MKKKLKEIFSVSRNERIGLLFIIAIIGVIIAGKWLSGANEETKTLESDQAVMELANATDSVKTDTVKRKRAKKRKKSNKENTTLTVAHMEEIKQY